MRIIFLILTTVYLFFGVRDVFAGDPPTQISPLNNSTVTSSKVEWQTPSYQLYSSKPYRVQVDDDFFFPSSTINKDYYTDNTSYTPVLTSGTWFWRVKARDVSSAWSDWSSVWSFTLQSVTSSPSPTTTSTPTPSSTPSSTSSPTSSSSFTISNIPSPINSDQSFNVSVSLSLSNSPNTTLYLKGAFKKADSSNYFGLTKVGGTWVKNNKTYSEQYKITTDSIGNWTGNLEIQPDILDSGYEGAGDYIFKVGRYTDSGSLTWSNEVTIKINAQEVTLDENPKDTPNVLGVNKRENKKRVSSKPKDEELSLEKYIKVASPASIAAATVSTQAEVKGEKQKNYIYWIGILMVLTGIGLFSYVYLRNRSLREAIFDLFRKRN